MDERSIDATARLMAEAGFDPAQAVNLWQNMMAAGGSRSPQWLSTHPDPANRIRELQRDAPSLNGVLQQGQAENLGVEADTAGEVVDLQGEPREVEDRGGHRAG